MPPYVKHRRSSIFRGHPKYHEDHTLLKKTNLSTKVRVFTLRVTTSNCR